MSINKINNSENQNNSEQSLSRDFKGIWIPKEIWLHQKISTSAKVLWSEIDSLYNEEKGGCFASDDYFMKFMNVSRPQLQRFMKELRDNNLLETISFNGRYRVIKSVFSQVRDSSYLKNETAPISKMRQLPRALYKDKTNNSDNKEEILMSEVYDHGLSDFFLSLILQNKPDFKKPNLKKWAKHIDLMIRVDKRDPEEIRRVMSWIAKDPFESTAVLSTEKLRKRFDQLQMKSKNINAKENQADNNKKIAKILLDKYIFPARVRAEMLSKHVEIVTDGAMSADCILYDTKGFEEQLLKAILKNRGYLKDKDLPKVKR